MDGHKRRIQDQFAGSAEAYARSATHARGDDLAQLAAWSPRGSELRALDVATGAGHTAAAIAPLVGEVVASDLTTTLLATARALFRRAGLRNASFICADAEALPFLASSFDVVSCRIAPHHFADVGAFVGEVARALRPGGTFLMEDSVVPDEPALGAFLNEVERIRDDTHVRSLPVSEWRDHLHASGLSVVAQALAPVPHPFDEWLERARTPEPRRILASAAFRDASPDVREAFAVDVAPGGRVRSYTDQKVLLLARKSGVASAR